MRALDTILGILSSALSLTVLTVAIAVAGFIVFFALTLSIQWGGFYWILTPAAIFVGFAVIEIAMEIGSIIDPIW